MSNATPRPRGRGCRWWARRALLGLLLVAAGVVGAGLLLGARARAQLRAAYPPPGQMVDVGGRRLHIYCQGAGQPTVVMEAGLGDPGLIWTLVQPAIASTTRACVYDRAGYGWSDPRPGARTAAAAVDDLHTLLQRSGEPGPYVLVGHSLGGLLVRVYTHRHRDDVAGLVLVDASHETQSQRFDPEFVASLAAITAQQARQLTIVRVLAATGLLALSPANWPTPDELPAPTAAAYRAMAAADPSTADAIVAEMRAFDALQAEVRAMQITDLGDVPLVVLSRGQRDELPPGVDVSPGALDRADQVWNAMQADLARQAADSSRVIATQSGHYIQLDQPDLVIEAVQDVVGRVRE